MRFPRLFLCRCMAVLLIALFLFPVSCQDSKGTSGAGPQPALKGLDAAGRMQISEEDRCPVCAMPVAAHEAFSAAIVLKDGTAFYFCAAGCMMRAWLHPEVHLGREEGALGRTVARDYFSGDFVDGHQVLWVSGSDVIGPMGPALVPLKDSSDLAAFRRRHGGKEVFRLGNLDDENWERFTGKRVER
ncbi:MAG: nitrous oxide reductase accessory protein NosL [Desulfobacterales bacterium]|nr:nitrous oxide reductase accessory protein NosL [Desulfobacterales bacterium]